MRLFKDLFPALGAAFVLLSGGIPAHAQPVFQPRTILVVYDSTEAFNRSSDFNLVHMSAEMPLNHLGMKVHYHDINGGIPAADSLADVYGILTWFADDEMNDPEIFAEWLAEQIENGKKYVLLGHIGILRDRVSGKDVPRSTINRVFRHLGLEYVGNWTEDPLHIEIVYKEPEMVEFERTLENETPIYEQVLSLSEENRVYLSLNRTDIPNGKSAAVITAPNGGLALFPYEIFQSDLTPELRWRLNPFRFFEEAFGLESLPRYDPTTLFGRRIFYSHIDGDGVRNLSKRHIGTPSGSVIRDEILKVYDLPITVSFITAEIDPQYLGSERMIELAKEILAYDNVETAVHAFTHPLHWKNKLTAFTVPGYSKKRNLLTEEEVIGPYPEAVLVIADDQTYLDREIRESIEYTNQILAPREKPVKIFQWSGNCKPEPEAIGLTRQLGVLNINGGDTRFDHFYPSYTGVAPLARQVGKERQIYASNANENIYTEGWRGPFYGFRNVIQTFEETEIPTLVKAKPRRVAPINIYYHFYSGERDAALTALKQTYDYALQQEIIPIFTSHYASLADSFFAAHIRGDSEAGWEFINYGNLQTVRLDSTALVPDLEKSEGILGFRRHHEALYIHLAEGESARLILTEQNQVKPYLIEASTVPSDIRIEREGAVFYTRGFGEAVYRFANMQPKKKYNITVSYRGEGDPHFQRFFKADAAGELKIVFPAKGNVRVDVKS